MDFPTIARRRGAGLDLGAVVAAVSDAHRCAGVRRALASKYIALEGIEDGVWNILCYRTLLGGFDQETGKIIGADLRSEQGQNL